MHPTADRSEYGRQLKNAEDLAKQKKLRRWKDYVEEKEEEQRVEEDRVVSRLHVSSTSSLTKRVLEP